MGFMNRIMQAKSMLFAERKGGSLLGFNMAPVLIHRASVQDLLQGRKFRFRQRYFVGLQVFQDPFPVYQTGDRYQIEI